MTRTAQLCGGPERATTVNIARAKDKAIVALNTLNEGWALKGSASNCRAGDA